MIRLLRDALLCIFLGFLSVACLKFISVLGILETASVHATAVIALSGPNLVEASREASEFAKEQRRYLKATSKTTFLILKDVHHVVGDTHNAIGLLSENINQAIVNIDHSETELAKGGLSNLTHSEELLEHATTQVDDLSYKLGLLLAAGRGNLENIERIGPHIDAVAEHAEATSKNMEEATGYIRDMLSPKKVSFWRRILELAIPRPTVKVP